MSNLLHDLYLELYGPLDGPGRLKNLAEMAETLSRLVGKTPAWTARYLNGILKGHKGFAISVDLEKALHALAGRIEGQHPLQALVKPVNVFSINGHVKAGSIILGETKPCHGCHTPIVPRVPWQKYCCPECRVKNRPKSIPCTASALAKSGEKA